MQLAFVQVDAAVWWHLQSELLLVLTFALGALANCLWCGAADTTSVGSEGPIEAPEGMQQHLLCLAQPSAVLPGVID